MSSLEEAESFLEIVGHKFEKYPILLQILLKFRSVIPTAQISNNNRSWIRMILDAFLKSATSLGEKFLIERIVVKLISVVAFKHVVKIIEKFILLSVVLSARRIILPITIVVGSIFAISISIIENSIFAKKGTMLS